MPIGRVWDHKIITYHIANGTADIINSDENQAIRSAFDLWQSASNLLFIQVCNANDADIVLSWENFNHGDPVPACYPGLDGFDGQNGVLAHSMGGPGPNNCNNQAGDIHFDDGETWTTDVRVIPSQPIDLVTVAAHEIGHSLGLFHTTVAGSLMEALYSGSHRFLGVDDIAGIQSLYGAPSNNFISGPSSFCTTANYSIPNLPTGATVTWSVTGSYIISGPNTANPVTVQRTSNGYGVLTANITTNCGAYTVTKNLSPLAITFSPWGSGNGPCGEGAASVDIPSGSNFNWEVTGDLTINGGGQTLSTTDNNIAITGTSGTIAVTFSGCGSPIYLDYNYEPYKREIIVGANPMVGSDPLSASIQNIDYPYTAIKWYIDGIEVYNMWGSPEMFFDTSNPPCGTHVLSAKAVLTCGATVDIGSVDIERYCSGWWRSMVIYPNPASSYLNIQSDAEKLKTLSATEKSAMKEYEVSLYDINGKLLLKGKSNGYKLNLDTRHLKSDNYFIHIKIDGEKEMIKKQVIIRN
ncbi:matrixin family metalloprotease [Pedobacter sp.]